MKELREYIRYALETGSHKSAFVEIEGAFNGSGIILDLSTGGFSFSIEMKNIEDFKFDLEKFLFIRINFDKFVINAEVEKKWSFIKNEDIDRIYTAGVTFNVISHEDRLRLNEIIEYLRSVSPAYLNQINKQ